MPSGLLDRGQEAPALTELQRLIREGRLEKRYLSLLVGELPGKPFTVNQPCSSPPCRVASAWCGSMRKASHRSAISA